MQRNLCQVPPAPLAFSVRPLDRGRATEIALVAERMRATLAEVLGAEGHAMYTLDWLQDRVRWHLQPDQCEGQVFLAVSAPGEVIGHLIARVEHDPEVGRLGLVSTIYVLPPHRRSGVAQALLDAGEGWLLERRIATLATDTSQTNLPLLRLFGSRGYAVSFHSVEKRMVRLSRPTVPPPAAPGGHSRRDG